MVLAFGSLVGGAYFEWTHGFAQFLAATPSLACLPAVNCRRWIAAGPALRDFEMLK